MSKKKKSLGDAVVVGSALAGAALGAAAVILSDKKNQEKIKKTVDEISNEAIIIGKKIKDKAEEFTKSSQKKAKSTPVKAKVKKATKVTKIYTPLKKT